jgi:hypothetical protein
MGAQYSNNALAGPISRACPAEGLAWSNSAVMPEAWSALPHAPAVIVTTEAARTLFPAFGALGEPELSLARDPSGQRLAFYDAEVSRGAPRKKRGPP